VDDKTNRKPHHRRSIRLAGYDYASEGGYYVTIVTQGRACLFGEVVDGEMRLNDFGRIVHEEWYRTAKLRPNVEILEDEFVVMPNHVHGIVWIEDDGRGRGDRPVAPTKPIGPTPKSIGSFVGGFKSSVTKRINALRYTPGAPIWQRNYYEHIINSEKDYENIVNYIDSNPLQWELDKENDHHQ
jgi:REP element-mobilizing transposase RayT